MILPAPGEQSLIPEAALTVYLLFGMHPAKIAPPIEETLSAGAARRYSPINRSIVSLRKLAYRISPFACGGCRPLQLSTLVEGVGFRILQSEVIVQLGVPSQVIYAKN
jgi:hypothetical protein